MEQDNTFKITLNSSYTNDVMWVDSAKSQVFLIKSDPVHIYGKWYHKLLNKITFNKRFCEGWEHNIEKISE